MKYLGWFLSINANGNCADNGSPFSSDVVTISNNSTGVEQVSAVKTARYSLPFYSESIISSDMSHLLEFLVSFRGIHSVLNTQEDFIVALQSAYNLADQIKANLGLDVFPYSVFYIFFEQYLYIQDVAWITIGLALIGALLRGFYVTAPRADLSCVSNFDCDAADAGQHCAVAHHHRHCRYD